MLEFKLPDFLNESDEEIHNRMLKVAPRNFDVSEGSLFFDLTKPTALEKSRMIEFQLALTVMMMFPQFAEGDYLEYHAKRDGIERRPPVRSRGVISFHGEPGTKIPEGTIVSTVGTENSPEIEFRTLKEVTIDDSGSVDVEIESVLAGSTANVPAETIVNVAGLNDIQAVINEAATEGGADEESDDSLRSRILDQNKNRQLAGSVSDYIAWAKEIPGVGEVHVIPEWDGAGTVKVLITDVQGGLASPELIAGVQNHIAPNGRRGGGKAPIGALVTVDTVDPLMVNISVSVIFESMYDKAIVLEGITSAIREYLSSLPANSIVRYSKIGSIIIRVSGVADYDSQSLVINGQKENIRLGETEIPMLGEVNVSEVNFIE